MLVFFFKRVTLVKEMYVIIIIIIILFLNKKIQKKKNYEIHLHLFSSIYLRVSFGNDVPFDLIHDSNDFRKMSTILLDIL